MLYLVLALAVPVVLLGGLLALERYERHVLQPVMLPVGLPAAPVVAPEPPEVPEQREPVTPVLQPAGPGASLGPAVNPPLTVSVVGLDLAG